MKTYFLIILIIAGYLTADAQSNGTECLHALYDKAAYKTYRIYKRDTLIKFNNGVNIYSSQCLLKFRNDTVVSIDGIEYNVKADTITEFIDPVYQRLNIPVIPTIIDTIRDPEDISIILAIDTINSISVRYAQIYKLNPEAFFESIKQIEKSAESQRINVPEIVVTLFNSSNPKKSLGSIEKNDFNGVEYAKANFLFESNGQMMTYPIIFKI